MEGERTEYSWGEGNNGSTQSRLVRTNDPEMARLVGVWGVLGSIMGAVCVICLSFMGVINRTENMADIMTRSETRQIDIINSVFGTEFTNIDDARGSDY